MFPVETQHSPHQESVPPWRRTPLACTHCRTRKIRCDRRIRGEQCTNCRLDAIECTMGDTSEKWAKNKKRRKSSPKASSLRHETTHQPSSTGHRLSRRGTSVRQLAGVQTTLPDFIKPLPSHLTAEDRDFLVHRGVLEIPEVRWRNEILRSYFQSVHPFMPLLDVEAFLEPMVRRSSRSKVSLLLLNAVMCSGALHVNTHVLRALGYNTRKAARRAFFEKARLLYDFDCEADRLVLVQAFLLMTYWYDTREHQKDRKYWMRVSVTLALDLGLDLDLENCNTERRRLLKRIWWCCFMRDQFCALVTWTPPQLGARYHSLPMLDLDDFEIGELPESISFVFGGCTSISSQRTRIQLAALCIEKAKLSLCINQILQVRYASLRHESEGQPMMILVPKDAAAANPFEVVEYDLKLQAWYDNLSDMSNFDLRDPSISTFMKEAEVVTIHRAHLKLLFLGVMLALHRPQVLDRSAIVPLRLQNLSRIKLRDAASETAHFARRIKNLELGTHISPGGVSLLLPTLLVHLQDIMPRMDNLPGIRRERYHDCMQMLDSIHDADLSEGFLPLELESAFHKLNILPHQQEDQNHLNQLIFPANIMSGCENLSLLADVMLPYISHLGTITPSEVNLLNELKGAHVGDQGNDVDMCESDHENGEEYDVEYVDLPSLEMGLFQP